MPIQILMPALSPTMEEGALSRWMVKEGDAVSAGDVIAEIETDKATMEFEAVDEGVIGKILVQEGTEGVKVNTPIAVLLEEGEDASDAEAAPAPAAPEEAEKAPAAPKETERDKAADTPKDAPPPKKSAEAPASGDRIFASPLARRIARERGLDLADLEGSGPRGRIVKADVEGAEPRKADAPKSPETAEPVQKPSMGADAVMKMYEGVDYEEVQLDGMRRTVARRLTEAKRDIPHFYLRRDVILDPLLDFRKTLNEALAPRGVKLSVNDFIVKASAVALQEVPDCNAVWAGDRILRFKASDVAVAVAVEGGLFTPVIRNAEAKSLSALSAEMKSLAEKARTRRLQPREYLGGSFAISNLGMYGIDNFDAVINPPHGSILAVGAGVRRPVVGADDQVEVATVMSCTLSVDHRVIDGALGARFLEALKSCLENPMALLA